MTKRSDKCIVLLFCLFLGLMLLFFLLLPKGSWSGKEKRYLAQAPSLRTADLLSGRFAEDAEDYAADHLPGRDLLVGLHAHFLLLTGRQASREVLLCRGGRLVEAQVALDRAAVEENMEAVRAFAGNAPCPVDLMLVPCAGAVLDGELPALGGPYDDAETISLAYELAGDRLGTVELLAPFTEAAEPGALYYRTDHHWTAEGAWLACRTYLSGIGRETLPKESYRVREVEGFRGTTWSRGGFWELPAETLAIWDSGGRFLAENAESEGVHQGLFYEERLSEDDKYPVFLDGNHSLVRVRQEGGGEGKLLVVRDSFGSSLGCFLADSYEEVVLVDLRYYRGRVSQLLAEEDFDRVLILYSVNNFLQDGNIVFLD